MALRGASSGILSDALDGLAGAVFFAGLAGRFAVGLTAVFAGAACSDEPASRASTAEAATNSRRFKRFSGSRRTFLPGDAQVNPMKTIEPASAALETTDYNTSAA
jgi:hypothetical protein